MKSNGRSTCAERLASPFSCRDEGEIQPPAERLHLGYRHHVLAGAAEYDDVRVINHAVLARTVVVLRAIAQEQLALEPGEPRVELEEQAVGVAQHQRRGLYPAQRTADVHVVRRGVVLHLLARREVIAARRLLGLVADTVLSAERGQRRVRQRHDAARLELLVHPYQIALALGQERQDVVAVGVRLLGALHQRWRRAAAGEYPLHGDA